jgi:hypothetical protein
MSTIPIKILAPNLSHNGPNKKRITIVPATEQIFDVHACCGLRLRDFLISGINGAIANQMKNARKKQNQEQWNARMCGLAMLNNLISVALSFWFGSTFNE